MNPWPVALDMPGWTQGRCFQILVLYVGFFCLFWYTFARFRCFGWCLSEFCLFFCFGMSIDMFCELSVVLWNSDPHFESGTEKCHRDTGLGKLNDSLRPSNIGLFLCSCSWFLPSHHPLAPRLGALGALGLRAEAHLVLKRFWGAAGEPYSILQWH